MKRGQRGKTYTPEMIQALQARHACNKSQSEFARLINVSVRTIQEWEQGRRKPTGAALTLLRLIAARPSIVKDLAA